MKRKETIALFKEQFLEGKSEEAREKFETKEIGKQYASIVAWKRRKGISAATSQSASDIMELLRKAKKSVSQLENLTEKETEKIIALCQEVSDEIAGFDQIKKSRQLRELKLQQDELARKIADLENEGVK